MSAAMKSKASEYSIKPLDVASSQDTEKVWQLWQIVFPAWPMSQERMQLLLTTLSGIHGLHQHGFYLSFFKKDVAGQIAAVGVLPEHRRKGLGSAMVADAKSRLRRAAVDAGAEELKTIEIGSSAPRFWPQMPVKLPSAVHDFFKSAGFKKTEDQGVRDLYKSIRDSIAPPDIIEKASKSPLIFSTWSADLAEECITKQKALFSWSKAYEAIAHYGQWDQVMVAIDPETNAQVGWTLMCDSSAIVSQIYAFMPLMPSGDKTGLIAAVGVDETARGKGIGLALMVKALEHLKQRGVEGVFVDCVGIKGFYEQLGFETKWQYESWKSLEVSVST